MNLPLRKTGLLVVLLAFAGYALMALRGPNGIPALLAKQQQIRELQKANAELAADNERRRDRIRRLQSSQAEQELEIRERLKKFKPEETQIILAEPSKE